MNSIEKLIAKRKPQRQTQKGFTLVEIAIVLVIIGLLLGGVLKGQEMINSAKIKSDTDTLVALQASTYAYRDRMGFYPGTLRAKTPADATADKFQIVDEETYASAAKTVPTLGNFFEDLTDQQFLKDANLAPQLDEAGSFYAGYAVDVTAGANAAGTAPTLEPNKNYVCIVYTSDIDNADEIVRGMDLKLDDGIADAGKFRASADTGCLEI